MEDHDWPNDIPGKETSQWVRQLLCEPRKTERKKSGAHHRGKEARRGGHRWRRGRGSERVRSWEELRGRRWTWLEVQAVLLICREEEVCGGRKGTSSRRIKKPRASEVEVEAQGGGAE